MEKKFEMNLLNAEETQELRGGCGWCVIDSRCSCVPTDTVPPVPTDTVPRPSFMMPTNGMLSTDMFLSSDTFLTSNQSSEKLSLLHAPWLHS